MTPSLASSERADANLRRPAQLAEPVLSFVEWLGQGLPIDESVRPRARAAGVSEKKMATLDQVPLALNFPEITKRLEPAVPNARCDHSGDFRAFLNFFCQRCSLPQLCHPVTGLLDQPIAESSSS